MLMISLNNYQPIIHSKIFFDISDLKEFQNRVSVLKNLNEKKIKKKY